MSVGIYRGMIGKKDTTPFLLIKGGQHTGFETCIGSMKHESDPTRGLRILV